MVSVNIDYEHIPIHFLVRKKVSQNTQYFVEHFLMLKGGTNLIPAILNMESDRKDLKSLIRMIRKCLDLNPEISNIVSSGLGISFS
jgi:hypothetical protein